MIVLEMKDWVKTKSVCLSLSVSGNNALETSLSHYLHTYETLAQASKYITMTCTSVLRSTKWLLSFPLLEIIFFLIPWVGSGRDGHKYVESGYYHIRHHRDVRPYKWNFYAALNFLNYFCYLVRLSHLPLNFDFCLLHINLIVFVTLGFLFMQLGKGL